MAHTDHRGEHGIGGGEGLIEALAPVLHAAVVVQQFALVLFHQGTGSAVRDWCVYRRRVCGARTDGPACTGGVRRRRFWRTADRPR